MHEIIAPAIEELCNKFERGGYNPTPVIDLGVLVANADGTIDEHERALLLEVFQALLETTVTAEVVNALIRASVEVIEVAGADARTRLVSAILSDCDAVEPGLRVAIAIAFASEGLTADERRVIDAIAQATGIDRERVDELIAEVKKYTDEGGPTSARMSLLPQTTK